MIVPGPGPLLVSVEGDEPAASGLAGKIHAALTRAGRRAVVLDPLPPSEHEIDLRLHFWNLADPGTQPADPGTQNDLYPQTDVWILPGALASMPDVVRVPAVSSAEDLDAAADRAVRQIEIEMGAPARARARGVLGALLAGGRSRRMGRDKAALPVILPGGAPPHPGEDVSARAPLTWLARTLFVLGERFADPWVVGRELRAGDPECALLRRIPPSRGDLRDRGGPLVGYETALAAATGGAVLVVPCDLPRLSVSVIDRLLEARGQAPVIAFRHADGRMEPGVVLLESAVAPSLTRFLDGGGRAAHEFLSVSEVAWIEISPDLAAQFLNVNTPADLAAVRAAGGTGISADD